jgi:hypothetical protein
MKELALGAIIAAAISAFYFSVAPLIGIIFSEVMVQAFK